MLPRTPRGDQRSPIASTMAVLAAIGWLSFSGILKRPWKSITYEEVNLHDDDSVAEAKAGIARCVAFYNTRRPHSA